MMMMMLGTWWCVLLLAHEGEGRLYRRCWAGDILIAADTSRWSAWLPPYRGKDPSATLAHLGRVDLLSLARRMETPPTQDPVS